LEELKSVSDAQLREQHFFDQNVLLQDEMNLFLSPRESLLSSTSSDGTPGSSSRSSFSLASHFKKNASTNSGSSSEEKPKVPVKEQGMMFEQQILAFNDMTLKLNKKLALAKGRKVTVLMPRPTQRNFIQKERQREQLASIRDEDMVMVGSKF